MKTYPHLENLERPWGTVDDWEGRILWILVLAKVGFGIILSIVEMFIIFVDNLKLQREILNQNDEASIQSMSWKIRRKSLSTMWSVYFERELKIPAEFHEKEFESRAPHTVTGFFNKISWLSNIGFIVAQVAAICTGIQAARTLLVSMIFIIICEYLLLFLWLQTHSQVGQFVLTVVNILERDLIGFAVVFIVVQLIFTICFLFLAEEDDVWHRWLRAFFIWYELSVGTGEWFKDRFDDVVVDTDEGFVMDPCRRTLFYLTYVAYISITLVILLNLLIAVMSETTLSVTKDMKLWKRNLRLSSVSLLSRRLRSAYYIARFFRFRILCCSENYRTYTIGGQSGKSTKILDGRVEIRQDAMNRISTIYTKKLLDQLDLREYFSEMRYWNVLEREDMGIDKDGRKIAKCIEITKQADVERTEIVKQILSDYLDYRGSVTTLL